MTRIHTSLTGLATLAALGLAAALPQAAHAQSSLDLGDGDNVTVSGAGTVGTIGGTPIAYNTTSYSDPGDYVVRTRGTAVFTLGAGGSLTETSVGNPGLHAQGSGAVTVSGGAISANGQEDIGLFATGSGAVTVSGGTISATGYIGTALEAAGSGAVTISGGTFSATGQDGLGLFANGGTIDLFSLGDTPFLIDGVPMNNTTLVSNQYISGNDTISGTLLDGETLDTTFANSTAFGGQAATFNLNVGTPPALPTPEPSAFVGLGIGLLGLGALGVKARRRLSRTEA